MHSSQVWQFELTEREREVLRATLEEYIASAQPVSSKALAKSCFADLSPATLRSVLNRLVDLGLLKQSHASAGRVPSERGFRYYCQVLMQPATLSQRERQAFSSAFEPKDHPLDSIREASRFLSRSSSQIGLATAPNLETTIFRQIQFVRVASDRILVIFVAQSGIIEQRVVHWENAPTQDDLWKMGAYLNAMLENLTLGEVRRRIAEQIESERVRFIHLEQEALHLQQVFLVQQSATDLYVEGHSFLVEKPEFASGDRAAALFRVLAEKEKILQILELADARPQDTTRIVMGEDLGQKELSGITFVTRTYGPAEQPLGTIAIAGPTRMDYGRIVPILEFTAQQLNTWLDDEHDTREGR